MGKGGKILVNVFLIGVGVVLILLGIGRFRAVANGCYYTKNVPNITGIGAHRGNYSHVQCYSTFVPGAKAVHTAGTAVSGFFYVAGGGLLILIVVLALIIGLARGKGSGPGTPVAPGGFPPYQPQPYQPQPYQPQYQSQPYQPYQSQPYQPPGYPPQQPPPFTRKP
jgi:hypothetical protein